MSITEVNEKVPRNLNLPLKEPKRFTVIAVNQVIWARVSEDYITLRVVGEDSPVSIDNKDELFNFYFKMFNNQKSEMLKRSLGLTK